MDDRPVKMLVEIQPPKKRRWPFRGYKTLPPVERYVPLTDAEMAQRERDQREMAA